MVQPLPSSPSGPTHAPSDAEPTLEASSTPAISEMARVFNTALVGTRAESERDVAAGLAEITAEPAFTAILEAVTAYARKYGLSERHAAEQVIRTFRKADQLWADYLYRQGIDRLRG